MTAISQDWQVSVAPVTDESNELLLGPGTPYFVERFLDLGVDDLRTDDTPRPLDHGLDPARDLLGGREQTLGVVVFGTAEDAAAGTGRTPAQVMANQDALIGAWLARSLDASEASPAAPTMLLRYRLPGVGVRRLYGRARKVARNDDTAPFGYARTLLQFVATDPLQYADDQTVATLTITQATTGGLTFPVTFPATFRSLTQADLVVANAGNVSVRPRIVVTGPVVNPRVDNVEDGTFMQVNLTLAGGEQLVIDSDARRVLLAGTASRAHLMQAGSTFPRLRPGTNTLRLSGTWATGDQPTLAATYRSAWI